jgi:hypothetical protein
MLGAAAMLAGCNSWMVTRNDPGPSLRGLRLDGQFFQLDVDSIIVGR